MRTVNPGRSVKGRASTSRLRKLLPLMAMLVILTVTGARFGTSASAVGTEPTTTSGVLDSASITYGDTAGGTITVTGSVSDGGSGLIDPTGTVTLYYCYDALATPASCDENSGTAITAFPLSGGTTTDDGISTVSVTGWTPAQGAGYYTIVSFYSGDSTYASSSDTDNLTVAKADITITAADKEVAYGAASQPTYTFTASGFKGTDTESDLDTAPDCALPLATTYDPATAQAGDTFVIECSGGSDANYNITGYTNGTLTVVPALLSLTIANANVEYGEAEPTPYSYTLTGFANGEDETALDVGVLCNLGENTYFVTDPAGTTYDIYCTFADSNYTFDPATPTGTLTVTKAPLTVTADNDSVTYGDAKPASFAYTVDTNQLKNGDSDSVLSGVTCDAAYTSSTGVASSPVDIICSGGTADNYEPTYVDGQLTIAKAPLTVIADDVTVTYGDAEPAEYTYTVDPAGLLNGDSDSVLSGVICDSAYTSSTGVDSSPVSITCSGGTADNYEVTTYTPGDLTIEKADIEITADDVNVEYGDAEPATYTFTASGLVNGEDESVLDTPPTCALATGSTYSTSDDVDTVYVIECTGGSDANYNITVHNPGAFNVDPATLSVTVQDETIEYGDPEPTYVITVTGFKNGEDEETATDYSAPTCSADSILTTSTITCTGGAAKNYVFDYTDGTLTVNPYEMQPPETWYTGQTFYYTKSTTDTAAQVTLTASITASFTCEEEGPSVADGFVTFKDPLSGKVYAKNVPIALVNDDCNEGIATAFATLTAGSNYVTSYVIVVEVTGALEGANYGTDSGYQLNADPGSATVTISTPQPPGTGLWGFGELAYKDNVSSTSLGTEGTLTSGMASGDAATFNYAFTYTTGKKPTLKGQVTLVIPGPDGSFYYVKSNSITSVTASGGNTATVYVKANITRVNADLSTESIEGGASLRLDMTETGALAGITLQSAKTSVLYYSNNWVKTGKAWSTVQQAISGEGAFITVN